MSKLKDFPASTQAIEPAWYGYGPEPTDQSAVTLAHYLWLLRRHRWKILAIVFFCVTATMITSVYLTPFYESTVTVDVDHRTPAAVLGQDATPRSGYDSDQFLVTQQKLIQSDAVLRPVVLQYHLLDVEKSGSDRTTGNTAEDAPILLKHLKVTRPPNSSLLLISYRSPDRQLSADVANAVARSYIERTYDIRFRSSAAETSFMEKQLEDFKVKMERSSAAVMQFERELSVINPEEKISILSARLLQLNTELTNSQTDRVRKESAWKSVQSGSLESAQASTQGENLKALSSKLDEARQQFADVKAHYDFNHPEYRKAAAAVEEIQGQLRDSRKNAALRVEVEYRESASRETMLEQAVAATKEEFDHLNSRSFEYQAVKHEADADKTLYEELIRKIKEAGINAGFQNSAIRIADPARAALKPVFPNMWLNGILAFLSSSLLAFGAVVLSDALDKSVRDPEQIATLFQLDLRGTLPFVKSWRHRVITAPENMGAGLALVQPEASAVPIRRERAVTGFEEAIRALRNSIVLGAFDRQCKSLMITSANAREGKTTTAVYLAIAHAQLRQKTLLIDCHLRQPGVHARLGINPEIGLVDVVQKDQPWRDTLVSLPEFPYLDILPAGQTGRKSDTGKTNPPAKGLGILPCRRAADVIGTYLPKILEEAAKEYDLIVIDAPPILGLPEPLQLAAAVDSVLLVAKGGKTSHLAVSSALNSLRLVKANVIGLVLNELTSETSDAYNYSGYCADYQKYARSV